MLVKIVEHTHDGKNDQDDPEKTHATAALSLGSADLVGLDV